MVKKKARKNQLAWSIENISTRDDDDADEDADEETDHLPAKEAAQPESLKSQVDQRLSVIVKRKTPFYLILHSFRDRSTSHHPLLFLERLSFNLRSLSWSSSSYSLHLLHTQKGKYLSSHTLQVILLNLETENHETQGILGMRDKRCLFSLKNTETNNVTSNEGTKGKLDELEGEEPRRSRKWCIARWWWWFSILSILRGYNTCISHVVLKMMKRLSMLHLWPLHFMIN